jgi:hypothetical protein
MSIDRVLAIKMDWIPKLTHNDEKGMKAGEV